MSTRPSPRRAASIRAVCLAAIMLLSVVAIPLGTAAAPAAASTAATSTTAASTTGASTVTAGTIDGDHDTRSSIAAPTTHAQTAPPAVGRSAADAPFRSGALVYQGQTLALEVPDAVSDADSFQVRRYDTSDRRVGAFVREFTLDAADRHRLDTVRLRGDYVVTPAGDRSQTVRFDSDGVATGLVDASDARPVEVTEQSLRVEWGQDRITTNDDDVDLEIRSNRARYNLNVSADGLDYEDLENLFREGGAADNPDPYADRQPFAVDGAVHDAHADDDVLVIRGLSDGTLTADFTEIDAGTYRFTFEVTDTGVTSGAPVGDDDDDPPATEPDPAFFDLADLDPESATVEPGESITVSVTVTNVGGTAGTQTVELRVGDEPLADRELTLDRDAAETVSFDVDAPDEPGTYVHSVHTANASLAGSLVVEAPETPTPEPTPEETPEETPETTPEPTPMPEPEPEPTDDDAPGFGVVVAIAALVAATLLGVVRRTRRAGSAGAR